VTVKAKPAKKKNKTPTKAKAVPSWDHKNPLRKNDRKNELIEAHNNLNASTPGGGDTSRGRAISKPTK
jgi:hypothetical protein